MQKTTLARCTVAAAGAFVLLGSAGAALAEPAVEHDDGSVNVDVTIPESSGTLAMTVAGTSTSLTEDGSTAEARRFTGQLPTVTVTDTRDPEDITPSAFWVVLGTASDFTTAAGDTIPAERLGWVPALVGDTDPGEVAAGDPVDPAGSCPEPPAEGEPPVEDGECYPFGLRDQELLAMASDSATIRPTGSWSVDAQLVLQTEPDVAPGDYSSVITLSLFE